MAALALPWLRRLELRRTSLAVLTAACSLAWAQTDAPGPLPSYYTVPAAEHTDRMRQEAQVEARVEAVRDAVLAAQVPGAIVALHVQAGEMVKKGQTLLQIDARMARQGAAASQAQVSAAQAQLAVAQKEYERQQQLFAKRYISQAALDSAQAQWQAAQAQVRALQAQAQAAATQSHWHTVQAPFDGIVARVPVTLGDMAMPGTPLVALYDPSALRITAQLSSTQAQALRQATQAQAQVQVELAGSTPARLSVAAAKVQVLPSADPLTHTVPVRVALPQGLPTVVPGMFARLWLPADNNQAGSNRAGPGVSGAAAQRILVPVQAVVRRAEMTGVYVQGANGQPQLRQVRLGLAQGEQIEILSGVRPGDRVALEPQKAAKGR